ncbi:MAG: TIR domain-containing protein [Planctomycetota bacterium]
MNALGFDAFVSYNSEHYLYAQAIAKGLSSRGLSVFVDRWYLRLGMPWQEALEEILGSCRAVLVLVGRSGLGPWQQKEKNLALHLQSARLDFQVIPVLLDGASPPLGFLGLNTWVTLPPGSGMDDETLNRIAAELRTTSDLDVAPVAAERSARCPYRGLAPFREEDSDLFFGRSILIDRLKSAVTRASFVAVTGASGSGKSSVVRAGLLPALRRQKDKTWEAAVMRPGSQPFHALAGAFLPFTGEAESVTAVLGLGRELAADPTTALDVIISRVLDRQPGTDRLALVIDQFEELYTTRSVDRIRDDFTHALLDATLNLPLTVILTMRGDFLGRILDDRALCDRLEGATVHVGPMTREELAQSVREPARHVGITLEAGLTEQLLKDAANEPGNLPLLEFTLAQLWERRKGGVITNEAYHALDGLAGALAGHAENAYETLRPAEQVIAKRIFIALVTSGVSEKPTRRRALVTELGEDATEVVTSLARKRLLVTDRDSTTGTQLAEVAHEALIFNWPRFKEWLAEDKAFLDWCGRTRFLAEEWTRVGNEEEALLRGYRLTEAVELLKTRTNDIPLPLVHFINESAAADFRREEADRRAAERERELVETQRRYQAAESASQNFAHSIKSEVFYASHIADDFRVRLDRLNLPRTDETNLQAYAERLSAVMTRIRQISKMGPIFASLSSGYPIRAQVRSIPTRELQSIVERCAGSMVARMGLHKVRFQTSLGVAAEGVHCVQADESLLEVVITNLLDNAAKYSFQDTLVKVRITRMDECACLSFVNKGLRITQADIANVFERGWRGEEAAAVTGEGMGLGLWVSREILRASRGDLIAVPTNAGGLTEFRVLLPLCADDK